MRIKWSRVNRSMNEIKRIPNTLAGIGISVLIGKILHETLPSNEGQSLQGVNKYKAGTRPPLAHLQQTMCWNVGQ